MPSTILRPARESDIHALNAIHAHYINNTVMTFGLVASTDAQAQTKLGVIRSSGLPYIVALDSSSGTSEPIGYVYATHFRSAKEGYAHTVELSLYCHPEHTSKGLGSKLLRRMLDVLRTPEAWDEEWISGKARTEEGKVFQVMVIMALDETGNQGGWGLQKWIDSVYLQLSLR
ncbi:hypothetical protein H0H87_006871 [Tephrocybe sp. NHM501043]|nr:hypothetical protein H0H87_006871 [Tephrocybe sp. NHM501043]